MRIRYPFKNEQPTTDNLVISVVDGDGVAVSGATVSVVPKSETGTVTVTCQDSEENPLNSCGVILSTSAWDWSNPDISTLVGIGKLSENGVYSINEFTEQFVVTDTPVDVEYGDYYLSALDNNTNNTYAGTLTVDGDENITITLSGD